MLLWFLISQLTPLVVVLHLVAYEASLGSLEYFVLIMLWVVAVLVIEKTMPMLRTLALTLSGLSFVFVLLISFIYDPHWCVIVGFVGGLLNITAMMANQGKMPVINPHLEPEKGFFLLGNYSWEHQDLIMDFRHKFLDSNTRLLCLCDWIVIGNYSVASIGDVLISFSGLISLAHMILI